MSALPSLEAEVDDFFDPTCEWVEAAVGEECGADGTVFAVADALLVPAPSNTGSVVRRRANSPTILVCTAHLVAALDAHDDPFGCSLVMPMAERPARGRPPRAVS